MNDPDVQAIFDDFWRPLVCRADGSLDLEQVKKELFDYYYLMDRASTVYDHVTGGRISKTTTIAEDVIAEADSLAMREVEAAIKDEREQFLVAALVPMWGGRWSYRVGRLDPVMAWNTEAEATDHARKALGWEEP